MTPHDPHLPRAAHRSRHPRAPWPLVPWLLAAAACGGGDTAVAADFSIGVGAGVDRGRAECADPFACDRSSGYGKLEAGIRFGVAGEAGEARAVFFDAGRFKGGGTTPLGTRFGGAFEVAGLGLAGAYRWALAPQWSAGARAGIAVVRTRFEYADAALARVSKTTVQPLVGVDIGLALTSDLSLRLELDLTRFKVHTSHGGLRMFGLAVQHSF